jgi:hypothetical protein
MGAIGDHMALTDQEKLDQQTPAGSGQSGYNPDGSGKVNDFKPSGLPTSNWPPGLKADGQFSVHRDALTRVAGQMNADLTELQNTLSTLNGGGAGGATLGGWETADGMGNNAGQAYYGISTFYQSLNDVYDQVIGYLHQTVTNYADAETTTATAANNVGTDVAPGRPNGG